MECSEAYRQIVPYVKRHLSMDDTYHFINHVNECSECKDELEIYYILEYGLSEEYDEAGSFDFKDMLNEQLEQQLAEIESDRLVMSYYKFIYNIASIVLLFSIGLFLIRYII